jgi:prefoldin subunit 5
MKKFYSLVLVCVTLSVALQSQVPLFLEEQEVELEDTRSSAWVFPIYRDLEAALEDLKDYCKERSDVKMKKGGENVLIGEKVRIPSIADKRGDIIGYAFITENYYGMAMVFQLGYDISVSSEEWEPEMNNLRNYAKEFMSYHYERSFSRKIKDLEKELKDLEKDMNQTENKIKNMNNKIDNFHNKIGKEEDEVKVEEHKTEISALQSEINTMTATLPPMREQENQLRETINKIKTESHTYLSTIGTL